jgi:hypothetical protein
VDDRFVDGFLAGMIAVLITGPMALAAKLLKWIELGFSDFAGVLSLGRVPDTLMEQIYASAVDVMVSGALGIGFAFLVTIIGSKYLLFKGLFYAGFLWYFYYPTIAIAFLERVDMNVQTAMINGILAGLFGLVMAQAYYWLHVNK